MTQKTVTQTSTNALQTSGKTEYVIGAAVQRLKIPKKLESSTLAPGTMLQTFYGRIIPDAAPNFNNLIISGLPANTRVISVWMTEWINGNLSHAGGALYEVWSVQLFDSGRQCRVRYVLKWSRHLPTGAMIILGPG